MLAAVFIVVGVFVLWFVISTINLIVYDKRCKEWCAKRGLRIERVYLKDGSFGYVGRDDENLVYVKIPKDFGEPRESIGMRMSDFSWNGTDKVALEKDGEEVRLDYIGKKRDLV